MRLMPPARRCSARAPSIALPTPRPCQCGSIVTSSSFATSEPREVETRVAGDTGADDAASGVARQPDEADLGVGEEQVERALQRRQPAVAIARGRRAVVRVLAEERRKEALRRAPRRGGHRHALDSAQGGRDGVVQRAGSGFTHRGRRALRIASGTCTGRRVARSTQT